MSVCFRFTPRVLAISLLASLAAGPTPASAQAGAGDQGVPAVAAAPAPLPSGPLTLQQVLQLAEARSESVAIARTGIARVEGQVTQARAGLFPQLSASVGYDRALASEFSGIFDSASLGGSDTGDDSGLEDLPFGRRNTWRATLTFSQNLYSGGRLGAAMDLARIGRESAGQTLTTTRAQLLLDATQAYYDAALASRLVTIAEATLQQADATLRQTEAGFTAGTQPEFEVLRARVSRDNQAPVIIRQRAVRDIAMLRLKQLLDLPAGYDLQLADALGEETLPAPAPFADRVAAVEARLRTDLPRIELSVPADLPSPDRVAVAQAATALRLSEASLRLTEAARNPTAALNSSLARVAYPSDFYSPTFDRMNWTVGVSVNVPILTGGRQRGEEAVARADVQEAQLRVQQVRELADLDTRSAWAELLAARAAWATSAGTVQQANRAYAIADVRYRNGVSTQLELSDARLLLQQAEANRAQAARDLQVARAHVALLPELPLGTGTGGATSGTTTGTQQTTPQQQTPAQTTSGQQFTSASTQSGSGQAGSQ